MKMQTATGLLSRLALTWALCLALLPALADTRPLQVGVGQHIHATLLTPQGPGPFPAILLLHTSGGLQQADLDYGASLQQQGYVVLIPAFLAAYGIQSQNRKLAFTTYAQPLYADFVASLAQLRALPQVNGKALAAIGFSNGGYFALWLAATRQVQAGVSYYGALTAAGTDPSLHLFQQTFGPDSAPVLILHGCDDSTVSIGHAVDLDRILSAAQSPHAFYQYAGAEHRFERDSGSDNRAAALDAWQRTLSFLSHNLVH